MQSGDLKESNRIMILQLIRDRVCSRAEIAQILGMSRPAVSVLVGELIEDGLVQEIGRGQSSETGGKRPILLSFNHEAGQVISIFFNGEKFEVALTDLNSNVILQKKKIANIYSDYKKTFHEIVLEIETLKKEANEMGILAPIIACGIVLKGLVNTKTGTMFYSATLPYWKDVPVSEYFKEKLQVPVFIENDARAITLVELRNDPKKRNNLVCVTVGLGIGSGVVINNEIYRGPFEGAVNFAHTTVLDGGPLCQCGNKGCWEVLASNSAFLKELRSRDDKYESTDIDEVLDLYEAGNPLVREVLINYTGYWLGIGLANISRVFNPERIVIQGELTRAGEALKHKIEEVVSNRALPVFSQTEIVFSRTDKNVNVISASEIALKHFFTKEHHVDIWVPALERLGE